MEVADDAIRPGSLAEVVVELVRWWTAFEPSDQQKRALAGAIERVLWA